VLWVQHRRGESQVVMVVSRYIKGSLLDTTNRPFALTVTLFLFLFRTNMEGPGTSV